VTVGITVTGPPLNKLPALLLSFSRLSLSLISALRALQPCKDRAVAATPLNPIAAAAIVALLPILISFLVPFVSAYNAGAPRLSSSLSLASLRLSCSDSLTLEGGEAVLERSKCKEADPERPEENESDPERPEAEAEAEDLENFLLDIDTSTPGSSKGFGHFLGLLIDFHSLFSGIPISIILTFCLHQLHQSSIDRSHNLYSIPVGTTTPRRLAEMNFVIIAIAL
jgi:hypothetical protein